MVRSAVGGLFLPSTARATLFSLSSRPAPVVTSSPSLLAYLRQFSHSASPRSARVVVVIVLVSSLPIARIIATIERARNRAHAVKRLLEMNAGKTGGDATRETKGSRLIRVSFIRQIRILRDLNTTIMK